MKQIAILAIALMLTPLVLAHAGPPGPAHETRLIHDDNDDSLLYAAQLQGVIDNIAVDARESYSFVYGEPLLVFKLMLNSACAQEGAEYPNPCGVITETIQFTAAGAAHELTVETADQGATWTGAVDYLTQPTEIGDGTRYVIEVGVRFSTLGIVAGDELSEIFVQGGNSGGEADSMPQGLTAGAPEAWPPVDAQRYNIGTYTVRAPDYYATLVLDSEIGEPNLDADQMETRKLTISNPTEIDQDYAVIGSGTMGLHAIISDGATPGAAVNFALQAGASKEIEVAAHNMATKAGVGNWTIIVASSLGGYNAIMNTVHLDAPECAPVEDLGHADHGEAMVGEPMETIDGVEHIETDDCSEAMEHGPEEHTDDPEHTEDGHGHEEGEKESPVAPLALLLGALAIAVARRK